MRTAKSIADRALVLATANTDEQVAIAELSRLAGNNQRAAIEAEGICLSSRVDPAARRKAIEWLTNVIVQIHEGSLEQLAFSARVKRAFNTHDGADAAQSYLTILRDNMKDIANAQRRSMVLWLFTATAFELFNRAAIAEATIGPLKLRDISVIHKALPVVFAFLIYDVTTLGVLYLYCAVVWSETVRLVQEPLASNGLDLLLLPFGSSLLGPIWMPTGGLLTWLVGFFTATLRLGSIAFPLVFEGYAIVSLYRVFGAHDILVWLSAFFSIAFILYAIILFFASGASKLRRWTTRWSGSSDGL